MTYQAGLNELGAHIIVLGGCCYLQHNLDEAPRKVLDQGELA